MPADSAHNGPKPKLAQHALPFPLEGAAAEACDCIGGCLAFVVEARHVATPERVDAVAWALLSLHAHIDMHVKRFKVSLRHFEPLCCTYHTYWQTLLSLDVPGSSGFQLVITAAEFDARSEMSVKRFVTGLQAKPLGSKMGFLLLLTPCSYIPTHKAHAACLPAQGYVHSQLRQRTGAMLEVLERASFAAQEQKTRKTSSGRTFVEQAAAGTA